MMSTADLLDARRYERSRLVGALVTGRPDPIAGWLRAMVIGVIVGGVMLAGCALWPLMPWTG